VTTNRLIQDGRAAILARVNNPYTQIMTFRAPVDAYLDDEVIAWVGTGLWGPVGCVLGPTDPAARLMGELYHGGALGEITWLHLPRVEAERLDRYLPVVQVWDWDFRWLTGPPPAHPLAGQVVELSSEDLPRVDTLLDAALPDSSARPGSALVRAWYGIRDGTGELLGCAADESVGEVGFLGGIAVDPAYQGRGYGTALTAALAQRLAARHRSVALGVMADNARASALYHRLGFTGLLPRSSVAIG
jgi:GNAT superfamily N-acetyltransferase